MANRENMTSLLTVPSTASLDDWFVAPLDFERMVGENSIVVFGGAGTGKTVASQSLSHFAVGNDGELVRLIVRWKPALFAAETGSMSSANRLIQQALDACALELSAFLAGHPGRFKSVPGWVQSSICWFIQKNLRGNLEARLGPVFDGAKGAKFIFDQLLVKVEDLLVDPDPTQKMSELMPALKRLGINGVWFCTDGLEGWADAKQDQLMQELTAFLSALNIFEQPGLVFKLFLPIEMEPHVIRASGLNRRRLDGCYLHWQAENLQALVEKRLALAFGKKQFSLKSLCSSSALPAWLDRVGGESPREWLDQVEPLYLHYAEHDLDKPINEKIWKELRLKHPPHFWMDETNHKVKVGGREVPLNDVPPNAYKILQYLYVRNGQVVGKDELYYKIYSNLKELPKVVGDVGYEGPREYAGVIDTSLSRLRQAIEPDPSHPVILQTVRGHGIKLVSRW